MDRGYLRSWLTYRLLYPIKRRRMIKLFHTLGIDRFSLVFDIGAHLGDKTRFFADRNISVVAIEPQSAFFSRLSRYFKEDDKVILLNKAVGSTEGTMQLKVSSAFPTVSTLSTTFVESVSNKKGWKQVEWDSVEEVEVTTLDLLIAEYGLPDFVKIDVEGYEHEVLQGLTQHLPLVSFEYLPAFTEASINCISYLDGLGSYTYAFSPRETYRLDTDWLTGEEMVSFLSSAPTHGDIYGRLQ